MSVGLYGTRYNCDGKGLTVFTLDEKNARQLVDLGNRHSVTIKGIFAVSPAGNLSCIGREYTAGSKVFIWDDGTVGALEAEPFDGHVKSGRMKQEGAWCGPIGAAATQTTQQEGTVELGQQHGSAELTNADMQGVLTYAGNDPVLSPSHYLTGAVETIDVIRMTLGEEGFVAFCLGNAIKYRHRAGKKDKDAEAQDVRKAQFYEQMAAHVSGFNVSDPREVG